MNLDRSYGVLLHPTCLPGPGGVGVLGRQARDFIDWLKSAGARWWQVLPLGPTGYGDSPYQSLSSFAGNPYLIDLAALRDKGWLAEEDPIDMPEEWVDFGRLYEVKWAALRLAHQGFLRLASGKEKTDYKRFLEEEKFWVKDYALYRALKEKHDHKAWDGWPENLKRRKPGALDEAKKELADEVALHAWTQWVFDEQWAAIRAYAKERGVGLIGDIPIFVSHDSPEVWAHPEKFQLDDDGLPSVVAGVPPDYFSETGQLWGNPLYCWETLLADGFSWWLQRLRCVLKTCDLVRIDHFRGFESYWEVPGDASNAIKGRWVKAPGRELFAAMRAELGQVPVIAEDLGVITEEVEALRDELDLPGMKVLQFAFDGDEKNKFLPHLHEKHGNYVVYPGTHDNETTLGWYRNLSLKQREQVRDYVQSYDLEVSPEEQLPWAMIALALHSPAKLAMVSLQDIFGLGNEARMNTPATTDGNWSWRYRAKQLTDEHAMHLIQMAADNERLS